MSSEIGSNLGASERRGDELAELRENFSALLERSVSDWVPGGDWGRTIADEVWQVLAGRPEEIASGDRLRRQVLAVAMDCVAWRLVEVMRATDQRWFERLVRMFDLQLRGMIRGVAGAIQDSEIRDVEQDVWLTVWLKPPVRQSDSHSLTPFQSWLRKVARSKTLGYIGRRAGRRPIDAQAIEWLFEHTHGGGMRPEFAIVAALYVHCHMNPTKIVEGFGTATLHNIFAALQECKPPTVRYDVLRTALDAGAGDKTLEQFWPFARDLETLVEAVETCLLGVSSWAHNLKMDAQPTVHAHAGAEQSTDDKLRSDPWKAAMMLEAARLVLYDDKEPHETLAYVLNRFLRLRPEDIIADYSSLSLDDILKELPSELSTRFPFIANEDWLEHLGALRAALNRIKPEAGRIGDIHLGGYFDSSCSAVQAREITDWVRDVDRRFRSKIRDQEEAFLRAVFDGRGLPWEKLVFAFHELLRVPGDYISFISRVALQFLTMAFLSAYRTGGITARSLAKRRLDSCLEEFQKTLTYPVRAFIKDSDRLATLLARGARTGGLLTFDDLLSAGSRLERKNELLAWSSTVRRNVLDKLKVTGSGLIYAYVCAGF